MTFRGSWTARGARHRASPTDTLRARPVTRVVSHSKTAPACETASVVDAQFAFGLLVHPVLGVMVAGLLG
jgi:hypothetical protein